jgi:predicted esterase
MKLSALLTSLFLLSACAGSDGKTPIGTECDEEAFTSKACTCTDTDSKGKTTCEDGEVVCSSCESVSGGDDDADKQSGDDDDPVTPPAKIDAGGKKPTIDAATIKPTPASNDGGKVSVPVATNDDGGSAPVDTGDALEPVIPMVSGDCPEFKSGTATIGGQSGISISAGAKAEGTGALIFYWHGTGSSATEYASMLPAAVRTEITGAGGVIISFGASKNTGGDCSGTGTFGKDDFKIADLITACAVKNHGINPKRIYSTGCSAGGLMAGCMGIQRSNYIAAVAPNSGGITVGYGMLQDPKRVPNVLTMNGGSGDNVIVNFGQTSAAYDNWIISKGGFAINCEHSSGHCGAPAALQTSAWKFLKDHPFGTKPSPYAGGLPAGFHNTCKIWTMTAEKPLGGA